jgi:hypothetical protein
MPTIQLTEKDILQGKVVNPDWYRMRIDSVGEKLSKDGGSTNYPVDGVIIESENGDKEFAGVPITWNFNSKAIGFVTGLFEALGESVSAGERIQLEALEGREVLVFVENGEYEGRTVNRINHKYRSVG